MSYRRSLSAGVVAALAPAALLAPRAAAQCEVPVPETIEILPSDPNAEDHFGSSVALFGDVMVVGAKDDDDAVVSNSGAVYVYRFDGQTWVEEAKLYASDAADFAIFGNAVDLQDDLLVIGARDADLFLDGGGVLRRIGRAYVFRYDGADWVEEAILLGSESAEFDGFGQSVAIDGDRIVVGAYNEDDACNHPDPTVQLNCDSGAAYIFEFDGVSWNETAKLTPSDGEYRDRFGNDVAIQGDTVIVAAANEDNVGGPCPPNCSVLDGFGAVYVYEFDGAQWVESAKLVAPDSRDMFDHFGESVGVSGDWLLIGALGDSDLAASAGAAYAFRRDPNAPSGWTFTQKVFASDGGFGDFYGNSLAINGDLAIIAAHSEDLGAAPNVGSAYVYRLQGDTWVEQVKTIPSDGFDNDFTGGDVAIGSGRAAVCGIGHEHNLPNAGSMYVLAGVEDCNGNGTLDACEIASGSAADNNGNGIPDVCEQPGDLDGDGDVDLDDLTIALQNFAGPGVPSPGGDVDGDGDTDLDDLTIVLQNFGS